MENRPLAHKIQVNAGNVFDRRYTFGSTGQGDRLALSTTYISRFDHRLRSRVQPFHVFTPCPPIRLN